MKSILVVLSIMFFASSLVSFAQPKITPQERLKMLKEKLSLTKVQSAKVEAILIKSDKEIQKFRSDKNVDI